VVGGYWQAASNCGILKLAVRCGGSKATKLATWIGKDSGAKTSHHLGAVEVEWDAGGGVCVGGEMAQSRAQRPLLLLKGLVGAGVGSVMHT
jgi:hypothetical protein